MLIWMQKLPESDIRKVEACTSFVGLYVKKYIILTCSVLVYLFSEMYRIITHMV